MKAGGVIRANSVGQIALLFADRTQIRHDRNSTLLVKTIRADRGVSLDLKSGQMFGRANESAHSSPIASLSSPT